jgi:predicted nucleotidyltransferase component of viral defense system/DNA-directed RNA polymerase subunit RPC12/RpoP
MIDKREILDAATTFGLNPHVIEKDYVLGWLLWGISNHENLSAAWIFKGGTCLKKCFFETYRFSEDLDFTLTDAAHLNAAFLKKVFAEIGERIYEETGIEFPPDVQEFEIYDNPRGGKSCQGKIGYQGPVSPRGKSMPRIKLDLTADERVVLPPVSSPVFHPYSDVPEESIAVSSYAYEEAFAEKVRALAERARPRDLYDVVNLFRNAAARPAAALLLDVLRQKCDFKGIPIPDLTDLEPHRPTLEGGWSTMLAHQLPSLPPIETFWSELPAFFVWLKGGAAPPVPVAYMRVQGEEVIRTRSLRALVPSAVQSHLEVIRFAASNRLCIELDYDGSTRRVEAYSLRRTLEGNVILKAIKSATGEPRSYRVDRISGVRVTNQGFVPRYDIELSPTWPVDIMPTSTREPTPTMPKLRSPRSTMQGRPSGPTYVYQCSYCGKRFNHKSQNSDLNAHKNKSGYPCPGRHGFWVNTRY